MRRLCLALFFGAAAAPVLAAPLELVHVSAPAVNCKFDTDCTVYVSDSTAHFTLPGADGSAFLQSRTWPPGQAGTPGEGLHPYLYRLDLRNLAGVVALPCVDRLEIDFGPIARLDYDGDGDLDDVFVITAGGLGSVAPSSADRNGNVITFGFSPPVCSGVAPGMGETSYFFGLASDDAPRSITARLHDTTGGEQDLEARAPDHGLLPAPRVVSVVDLRARLLAQRERWQRVREELGPGWQVEWNRATATPRQVSGGRLRLPEPVTPANVERLAREVLLARGELLALDAQDLRFAEAEFEPPAAGGRGGGTWRVHFTQQYAGLPVVGGSARVVIRDHRVTAFGSDFVPGIEVSPKPAVEWGEALRTAVRGDPQLAEAKPQQVRLVILPVAVRDELRHHLAWELTMPVTRAPQPLVDPDAPAGGVAPRPEPEPARLLPAHWRIYVDAHSGAVLERRNLMRYQQVSGTVTAPVTPEHPGDPAETRPLARMSVTVVQGTPHTAATDDAGAYTVGGLVAGPGSLEAYLDAAHLRVWNSETGARASHTAALTVPAVHDWDWDADDASPGNVESNAYWHVDFIQQWFQRGDPFSVLPLPDPMEVYVRNGDYCNAGADDTGLYFGHGDGSCQDFSLCSDIVYHEYTHRIVHQVYDSAGVDLPYRDQTGAMNEGWADYFGASITGDSWHGEVCYGGRDIEPDLRFDADWVGEVHGDGKIFSGALWDLRSALGAPYTDALAMRAMKDVAVTFRGYLGAVLEEDDDPAFNPDPAANDDPTDGTPNVDSICGVFWDQHGIFHPHCTGYTGGPVAVIDLPSRFEFNLYDGSAVGVAVEGTALGSATEPLTAFRVEYAHADDPTTWLDAGVSLVGGGTSPVTDGPLADVSLAAVADGFYLLRLTAETASASASAISYFVLDRLLAAGWPQLQQVRFYGSPAVVDVDPSFPGLELVAQGWDTETGVLQLYVLHHDGSAAPGWPQSSPQSLVAPAVGDLDGDGRLEIVLNSTGGVVYAYADDGSPLPGWPVAMAAGTVWAYSVPALGDLDGDGDLEIVVGSASGEVYAWHHDATALAGWPVAVTGIVEAAPAVGDLDGDGTPEVVIGTRDQRVYALDGDGSVMAGWPQVLAGTPWVTGSAALADLDLDGDLEIAAATADFDGYDDYRLYLWHHDGTLLPGWPQALPTDLHRPGGVVFADLDADGDLELIVETNDDRVRAFEIDGSAVPGWPPPQPDANGWEFLVSSPAVADLDGDGHREVVAEGSWTRYSGLYRYELWALADDGAALAGWPRAVSSYSNRAPAVADLDLDGDVEVVLGSRGMFVWDLPGSWGLDSPEWPLHRHDAWRTGTYGAKAAAVLLFDTSGSMSWAPDGTIGVPESEQRLTFAKQAAIPFVEMLHDFNAGKASVGVATFPAHPADFPWTCDAQVVAPLRTITATSRAELVGTTIPGLTHEDNTPLLAGVRQAAAMFGAEARQVIVLLSDGYHNCPSVVDVGSAEVTDLLADLQRRGTRVFTIGFGDPDDIDHPLLEGLADGTTPTGYVGSQFYDVTTASFDPLTFDPATELQSVYKSILVDALDLQAVTDPTGRLAGGASLAVDVPISEHDRKVAFYVSWKTPSPRRLSVRVLAADGTPVTVSEPGVTVRSGATYRIVTAGRDLLTAPGKVGAHPWQIEILADGVAAGEEEPYQYSVIVDSTLRLAGGFDRTAYTTGHQLTLTARVTADGRPLTGLDDVTAVLAAPEDGRGNWLVRNPVSAEELEQVPPERGGELLSLAARKAYYLSEIRKLPPPGVLPPRAVRLYDDGTHGDRRKDDGVYSHRFSALAREGVHAFALTVKGTTAGGTPFAREVRFDRYVAVGAVPSASVVEAVPVAADVGSRYEVRVVPRDALGNYLGPGHPSSVTLLASQGTWLTGVRDAVDGSYRRVLELPPGVAVDEVTLQIGVGGETGEVPLTEAIGEEAEWSLSLHLGATQPQGGAHRRLDGDLYSGLDVERRLGARLRLIGRLDQHRFDGARPGIRDEEWRSASLGAGYDLSTGRVRPFVAAGVGLFVPDRGGSEIGYHLGLGVDVDLTRRLALEVAGDYFGLPGADPDLDWTVVRAGLKVRLPARP